MTQPVQRDVGGLVRVSVSADGQPLSDTILIREVIIERTVNRIPRATLRIADGSLAEETFELSSSDTFVPGVKIAISAGYDNRLSPVFEGVLIRHAISMDTSGESSLTVSCADPAIAITLNRRSRYFADSSDSDVMNQLISGAGLKADIAGAGEKHEHVVQNDATDWDFLLMRAAANGLVLLADGGRISLRPPDFSPPQYEVRFGQSLISFEAELDASSQVADVEVTAWDPATQSAVTAGASEPDAGTQGNLTGRKLAAVLPDNRISLRSFGPGSQNTLDAWAASRMMRSRLSRIRGRAQFSGHAGVLPGRTLLLSGLGSRFDGPAWVSSVTHRISAGTWETEVETGLKALPGSTGAAAAGPRAAAGLRPGASGLQIATVARVHDDPLSQQRILVTLPLSDNAMMWVRVLAPYASKDAGMSFLPEPGDEVIIAFLDDDPENPVCLGGLHSSGRPGPEPGSETNGLKTIRTRSGLTLQFDDDTGRVALKTAGGKHVTLDEDADTIELADSNGNRVVLEPSGLSLSSAGDIKISASGGLTLTAGGAARLDVTGALTADAASVELTASSSFSASGGMTELKGSGKVSVKGTIVEIN